MTKRFLVSAILALSAAYAVHAADKSDKMKPRWVTSSLPAPKSAGYIFMSSQGSGASLEEARQMALLNLTSKLEHERGLVVSSSLKVEKRDSREAGKSKNSQFTLEVNESGKRINITCRVVDEYWEKGGATYYVTQLYTVNDLTQPDSGSNRDNIILTTSYGAAPVVCSLIPGLGQFVKGSALKGGLVLGGTAVGAAAIILAENQRAANAKKMKEKPQHLDFYRNKKENWEIGRNVAIGVTAAIYIYNLVDAAVAPGRRRVRVERRGYDYAIAPVVYDNGVGLCFAMNF